MNLSASSQSLSFNNLLEIAGRVGLSVAGVLPLGVARELLEDSSANLKRWQASGCAGEMSYMLRDVKLFCDLPNFLPDVKSVVSFAVSYSNASVLPPKSGFGRIARYAWGRDYHDILKVRLKEFVLLVEEYLGTRSGLKWRVFSDAVPLFERALGEGSGLGFVGKNSMLIRPGLGSYFFLAEVLWDVDICIPEGSALLWRGRRGLAKIGNCLPPGENCGKCEQCISSCPTNAIVDSGVVDARRCISYLTIEKKTEFSVDESEAIGDWVFGCDICQEVCPFNRNGAPCEIEDFQAQNGVGAYIELESVLTIRTKKEYKLRFKDTALMRASREALIRNACCVVSNTRYFPALALLSRLMISDESALIRRQAEASLRVLAKDADGKDKRVIENAVSRRHGG